MNRNALFVLAGALVGGLAGYFIFVWLVTTFGAYGFAIPGVLVGLGATLRFGAPTVLFSTSAIAIRRSIALAADGRVLVNHFGEERSEPLKLIENWASGLYE